MFTFSLLYVTFYLFIFLSIFIITFSQIPLFVLTSFSLTNFIIFIQKYKPTKGIYFWLFFSLSGLPPVGLFFIKFNIFFFVLYQTHIFSVIILFLFFFLNMLYYLQLFNFKNFKKSMYPLLTPNIFILWRNNQFIWSNFSTHSTYSITLFSVNILFFLFFTVIFFTDYFLILYVLNVNNKSKTQLYI